jgi:hypothetical protein
VLVVQVPIAVGAKPPVQRDGPWEEEPEDGAADGAPAPDGAAEGARDKIWLPPGGLHDTLNSVTINNAASIHSTARIFMKLIPFRDTPMYKFSKPAKRRLHIFFVFSIKI